MRKFVVQSQGITPPYAVLSGNHSVVKVGHSRAELLLLISRVLFPFFFTSVLNTSISSHRETVRSFSMICTLFVDCKPSLQTHKWDGLYHTFIYYFFSDSLFLLCTLVKVHYGVNRLSVDGSGEE